MSVLRDSLAYPELSFTALDGEPMGGKCPQKWLQNEWDESKREAIDKAIRDATFNVGRVHYAMPTTTLGEGKSRYAASMKQLGERGITWGTYRDQPVSVPLDHARAIQDANGLWWPKPDFWYDRSHTGDYHVRGLWVTHAENGIATLRVGKTKQVLTIEQALSCPEDSFWYSTDMPAVLAELAK